MKTLYLMTKKFIVFLYNTILVFCCYPWLIIYRSFVFFMDFCVTCISNLIESITKMDVVSGVINWLLCKFTTLFNLIKNSVGNLGNWILTLINWRKIEELKRQLDEKERSERILREENVHLHHKVRQLETDVSSLSERLSKEMSSKIAADESSVENVGIRNRPMNIADDYHMICSNEWLDAKACLDDACEKFKDSMEETKVVFLSNIMMVAVEVSFEYCDRVFQTISDPFQTLSGDVTVEKQPKKLPKEVTNVVGDHLRNASSTVNYSALAQNIVNRLQKTVDKDWASLFMENEVKTYVEKVALCTWNMVIQRPPMTFQTCDVWKGKEYVDLHWASNIEPDKEPNIPTEFHNVYPMQFHGKQLMQKGKVLALRKISLPQEDSLDNESTIVDVETGNDKKEEFENVAYISETDDEKSTLLHQTKDKVKKTD